jgi:dsDNA-specific endonuclease/ATPase MutS2
MTKGARRRRAILERNRHFERLRTVGAEAPHRRRHALAPSTSRRRWPRTPPSATTSPQVRRRRLAVIDARHPVVERRTASSDVRAERHHAELGTCQLIILTGPNMGGKSTYLRQTALLCPTMAPPHSCRRANEVPLVDRIYARRRPDNIARSTRRSWSRCRRPPTSFTATSRSLVVLDEIGRGTATFDG